MLSELFENIGLEGNKEVSPRGAPIVIQLMILLISEKSKYGLSLKEDKWLW